MSDVVVRSSWSDIAEGKKAYNEILTLYAISGTDTVLCGIQQQPPKIGTVTPDGLSTYLRGTNLKSGNWGEWYKDTVVDNDSKPLTSLTYYMRNSISGFDITNLKCYVLFRNLYSNSVPLSISSWNLTTDDGTVIANGDGLEYGDRIEVEFINDYDTVNFKLTLNVIGTPSSVGHWYYLPYGETQVITSARTWTLKTYIPGGLFMSYWHNSGSWAYNFLATNETEYLTTSVAGLWIGYYTYYSSKGWSDMFPTNRVSYDSTTGKIYRNTAISGQSQWDSFLGLFCREVGATGYNSVNEAVSDLYGSPFGFNTTNFNDYIGDIFTARMYADISKRFPSTSNDDQTGGTLGTFDDTTDTNTVPVLPTADSYVPDEITGNNTTGFNIYKLSPSQFRNVRRALFSTDIITSLRNFFTKPTDGVISLGRMPYSPPPAGSDATIYIGNTALVYQDGVAVNAEGTPINRFNSYDFGNVTILPYWDTALDYNPYTEIKIHLPYIGTRNLNTDLIMGKAIGLKYHIDCITGTCVAFITADGDLVYQFTGNMMTPCPLSGEDYSQMYGNLLTSSVLAGVTVAAYGGNPIMSAGAGIGAANSALHSKREFTNNGTFGGSSSMMENNQPFIEIIRPVQSRPRDYGKYKGYVSTKTQLLGDCEGYVKILDCDLSGITATEEERDEIMELLKGGIYV